MNRPVLQMLTLRAVGALGSALFLTFFALTFSVPGWVETFAADYIESEARARIDSSIDAVRPPETGGALATLAASIVEQNEVQILKFKDDLKNRVYEQWADSIAAIRNLDCECRQKWEDWYELRLNANVAVLQVTNEQASRLIHGSYMDVVTELKRDIRIFTASNGLAFLLLLLVSFLKPAARLHLFVPGMLLALSTLVCSWFYIFEQNWLLTIIHNSYVGLAYVAWLGVVFAFLCDIVLNRGRITTEIINGFFSAIGSAASAVPC